MGELVYKDESYRIMGACFEVYKEMGCGFLEAVYQECLERELAERGIPFCPKKELQLSYKGKLLEQTYVPRPRLLREDHRGVEGGEEPLRRTPGASAQLFEGDRIQARVARQLRALPEGGIRADCRLSCCFEGTTEIEEGTTKYAKHAQEEKQRGRVHESWISQARLISYFFGNHEIRETHERREEGKRKTEGGELRIETVGEE